MPLRVNLDSLWSLWLCVRKQKTHRGSHEGTKAQRKIFCDSFPSAFAVGDYCVAPDEAWRNQAIPIPVTILPKGVCD